VAKSTARKPAPPREREAAAQRIMYDTVAGGEVNVRVDQIASVDEVVPSGVFDVPQATKEDVENIPIVILDAQRRTGKHGPWFICHAAYLDEIQNPDIGAAATRFTVPFNGTVLPEKMGKAMGIDPFTGSAIPGRANKLPIAGKLVQIEGDENTYWDFRDPNWEGDAPKAEKEKLVPRSR
jgi:hypothetical protein